ncbi:HTH-type transcriptional regulator BetI [Streptomyces microflavus]
MTPATRRTHHAAPPREDVLAAAMATVAERGLDGLTMAGLGREVGMSSGHLLDYFRTKDELLLQTLEWSENRLGAERRALLAEPGTARERLDAYIDLYLPAGHRDPHWTLWLEVWGRSQNADDEAPPAGRHRGRLAPGPGGAARRGGLAGGFRAVDADRFATRLRALLDGFSVHVTVGIPGTGREQVLVQAAEFLDETLTPGSWKSDANRRHDRILRHRRHGAFTVRDFCRVLVRHDYWQQARRSAVTVPYHHVRRGHRAPDPRETPHPRGVFSFSGPHPGRAERAG